MRIYFVGAQSSGKTTLARHVAKAHHLPLVSEVVRQPVAERERTLDDLRADLDAIDGLQWDIFQRQLATEKKTLEQHPAGFVSDRGFDFVVYTAANARTARLVVNDRDYMAYIASLKQTDAIVFFVRPHKELVKADAGRSALDLDWGAVCRIDGAIQYVLESESIPYVPIDGLSMRDRVRLVNRVIVLAMGVTA